MGLREVAEKDLAVTLQDTKCGFGWPIRLFNPDGHFIETNGQSNDIARLIDPDTGLAISGRYASVVLRISELLADGIGVPVGIADKTKKPWTVIFDDLNGREYKFKVMATDPDRTLGLVVCELEYLDD